MCKCLIQDSWVKHSVKVLFWKSKICLIHRHCELFIQHRSQAIQCCCYGNWCLCNYLITGRPAGVCLHGNLSWCETVMDRNYHTVEVPFQLGVHTKKTAPLPGFDIMKNTFSFYIPPKRAFIYQRSDQCTKSFPGVKFISDHLGKERTVPGIKGKKIVMTSKGFKLPCIKSHKSEWQVYWKTNIRNYQLMAGKNQKTMSKHIQWSQFTHPSPLANNESLIPEHYNAAN